MPEIELASSPVLLKLDLAGGQTCREGFECVDIWPGAKHCLDLWKFPWPWAKSTVDELWCSHHIEHIPMEYITHNDRRKDLFCAFMDECWRIMKPGASMTVICPCARNNRAFQDPTHRRFIVWESFLYFNKGWRELNKLDHYGIECNFDFSYMPQVPDPVHQLLHPEVQARRFNECWNVVSDWVFYLKALK